ncbi:Late embryogenesis abundant protein [Cinnamomum micranthum f. kanehirae]|uniref:Late embryogenesis abundant protein n=1 Tax=Cinnamomum micranthum f. kanehirae TaxID=337451 RepID=A0A443Q4A1_9MAGN|nr:Late embryogenesis abundant protein [Cinnamomum micranthum f. kanehirae]
MTTKETAVPKTLEPEQPPPRRFSRCCVVVTATFLLVLLLAAIVFILFFTLFKPKDPTTTLLSANVSGVSPRVSFPAVRIQLNVSLDLLVLIHNPNRAAFRHRPGKSLVLYRGKQVGEADVSPGRIPASGSERIPCRVTIEAEKFVSELGQLIGDVLSGEVGFHTTTRIPGKVTILGLFKRHAVAIAECHVVVGFPDLSIKRQDCQHHTNMYRALLYRGDGGGSNVSNV